VIDFNQPDNFGFLAEHDTFFQLASAAERAFSSDPDQAAPAGGSAHQAYRHHQWGRRV